MRFFKTLFILLAFVPGLAGPAFSASWFGGVNRGQLMSNDAGLGSDMIGVPGRSGTVSAYLPEAYSIDSAGAVGDGITDDSAAIAAALSSGHRVVTSNPEHDYYIGSTTVTVPQGVSFRLGHGSRLLYSGNGVAVKVESSLTTATEAGPDRMPVICQHVIRVKKTALEWDSTDSTSVGILLVNQRYSTFNISAENFHTGVRLYGSDDDGVSAGFTDNTFNIEYVRNNKVGIKFTSPDTSNSVHGWVNQNTFIGGLIKNDSGLGGVGSVSLDLSEIGNGNTFIGINMEGAAEKAFSVRWAQNVFLNCRFESGPILEFLAGSGQNLVLGGYGVIPSIVSDLNDESTSISNSRNIIIGGYENQFAVNDFAANIGNFKGQTLNDSLTVGLPGTSSMAAISMQDNTTGAIYSELDDRGALDVYYPTKGLYDATINPEGEVYPRVRIAGDGIYLSGGADSPYRVLRGYGDWFRFEGEGEMAQGVFKLRIPTYADNAEAIAGGAEGGNVYKTSTGELRIVY